MILRDATQQDWSVLDRMLRELAHEAPSWGRYVAYRSFQFLDRLMQSEDGLVRLVSDEEPRGLLVASVGEEPLSGRRVSCEHLLRLDESARGVETLNLLVEDWETWSFVRGAESLLFSTFNPRMTLYLQRRGYTPAETVHRRD